MRKKANNVVCRSNGPWLIGLLQLVHGYHVQNTLTIVSYVAMLWRLLYIFMGLCVAQQTIMILCCESVCAILDGGCVLMDRFSWSCMRSISFTYRLRG